MKWIHTPANYNGSGQPEFWRGYGKRACFTAERHAQGHFVLRQEGSIVGIGDTLTEVQTQAQQADRPARPRKRTAR